MKAVWVFLATMLALAGYEALRRRKCLKCWRPFAVFVGAQCRRCWRSR